jgi:hypothetical protein
MPNSLVIKAYDPQWPILFEELRVKCSELLGNMVSAIEHVGSTSVPGLAAKPTIVRIGRDAERLLTVLLLRVAQVTDAFCFLISESEERANTNQKQNTVTSPARSGGELKHKTE